MRRISATTIAIAAVLTCLAAAAPAATATKWVVKGRGFGHGIGMSQYGALGFAERGTGYRSILDHYYRRTSIGRARRNGVRVLLAAGVAEIPFTGATRACGRRLRAKKDYRFVASGGDAVLRRAGGAKVADCGRKGSARGGASVAYPGKGVYGGRLLALGARGGLDAVNAVGLEAYVQGVIANEMPSSWPQDALRAQAVAARSYVLATSRGGGAFDVYDDTRSQVYGGRSAETAATNRAAEATSREVVEHRGEVATTYFFSTSGGETENVEFGFPGASPVPYLKGVKDPYDGSSPHHRWREAFSQEQLQSRLGDLVRGRVRDVEVIKRGISPRIVRARVVGSDESKVVDGLTLQARLGLMSTWARFDRKRG